jgi:hypothetical protein
LVQLNVAHRALLDIEGGLKEVLMTPSEDQRLPGSTAPSRYNPM